MTPAEWFRKYPNSTPQDVAWCCGYYDAFTGSAPLMDSRDPLWPSYARGFGEGHADKATVLS